MGAVVPIPTLPELLVASKILPSKPVPVNLSEEFKIRSNPLLLLGIPSFIQALIVRFSPSLALIELVIVLGTLSTLLITTSPLAVILSLSLLLVLNTRSLLSVVPMNCVRGLIQAFPESPHPPPVAACQRALPTASVVSTYPLVAPEDIRRL